MSEIDTSVMRAGHGSNKLAHEYDYATCVECDDVWPCDVVRLCDALDEARADSQRWEIVAHARLEAWEPMKERVEKAEANAATYLHQRNDAEAAIARALAVLADPPVPSRMLIPIVRAALVGESG